MALLGQRGVLRRWPEAAKPGSIEQDYFLLANGKQVRERQGQQAMTTRTTARDLISKQEEIWNSHDATAVAAIYTENAVLQDPQYPESLAGREAIKKDAADFFAACPDIVFKVKKVISEGDTVAFEGMASGTHTGPLQLPTGLVPATNRRVEFSIAIFQELDASGNVREERRYYDLAGMLDQLGLMQ
jgi:steroid delta-isomerase-like uncharacterized protein